LQKAPPGKAVVNVKVNGGKPLSPVDPKTVRVNPLCDWTEVTR